MRKGARPAIARIYDDPATTEGARILVDRISPRGFSKDRAGLDDWIREAAPSDELRRWFGHDPPWWPAFRDQYRAELAARPEAVACLLEWCRRGPATLLFAVKDREHNNAVFLRDYLAERLMQDGEAG